MAILGRGFPVAPHIPETVAPTGAGSTGTIAVTQADDTFVAAGNQTHVGTSAVTQAADTMAAAGTTVHNGTVAWTQAADTMVAAGTVANPKVETLVDSFDSSLDKTVKWQDSAAAVVWDSGTASVKIPVTSAYPELQTGLVTGQAYDLTGSSVFAKVTCPTIAGTTREVFFKIIRQAPPGSFDTLEIQTSGTSLYAVKEETVGGVVNAGSKTYNPTTDAWWRFRESGGTIYYDTSPDGATWTNFATTTNPTWNITAVAVSFSAGYFGTEAASDAYIDNVNVAGTPTGTIAVTQADDTMSAAGNPVTTGTIAVTQAADTMVAAGTTVHNGTIDVIQDAQTMAAAGYSTHLGTADLTQAPDTMAASGSSTHVGTASWTQADDTMTAAGNPVITGTASWTQTDDTMVAFGIMGSNVAAWVQDDQTMVAAGYPTTTGAAVWTQADQTMLAAGTTPAVGAIAWTQDDQTMAGFSEHEPEAILTCRITGPALRRRVTGPGVEILRVTGPSNEPSEHVAGPALSRTATGPALIIRVADGPGVESLHVLGPDLSRDVVGPAIEEKYVLTGPGVCD